MKKLSGAILHGQNLTQAAKLGISRNETRAYSVCNAVRALSIGDQPTGYEGEVEQEVTRQFGAAKSQNAIRIPTGMALRDMTAGTPGAGGYLVGTDNLGNSFIDLLRNKLVAAAMGVTVLPNLRGHVTIPKQTVSGTAYWLANETTAITESQMTIGQLSLTPKTVGAYTEVSRQLIMQSSPAADAMIMNDLAKTVAMAIDSAILSGTGAGGQPTGLLNTAGIATVSGTAMAYAGIVEFMSDTANALQSADPATVGFLTTPTVAALLMQRQRFAGTDSPIWAGNTALGTCADTKAMSSNQVPSGTMIFGDWSQIIVGEWGLLEIASNPHANFTAGITGIRALQSVDVGVRQAGAFSVATSIT